MNPERLGCRDRVGLRIPLATRESPRCLRAEPRQFSTVLATTSQKKMGIGRLATWGVSIIVDGVVRATAGRLCVT
jgi:hypothetical protein